MVSTGQWRERSLSTYNPVPDLSTGLVSYPRVSRSKGISSKLQGQLPTQDEFDKYSSMIYVVTIREIKFHSLNQISCW